MNGGVGKGGIIGEGGTKDGGGGGTPHIKGDLVMITPLFISFSIFCGGCSNEIL